MTAPQKHFSDEQRTDCELAQIGAAGGIKERRTLAFRYERARRKRRATTGVEADRVDNRAENLAKLLDRVHRIFAEKKARRREAEGR
jgi:hypothetical protein